MATNKEAVLNVIATISHCKEMLNYSGIGETIEPSCNDVMTIYIKVNEREIIQKASFTITNSACAPVKAAAELICRMIEGLPVMTGYTISKEKISQEISDKDGISIEHLHCIIMAELTMKKAIINYAKKRNS